MNDTPPRRRRQTHYPTTPSKDAQADEKPQVLTPDVRAWLKRHDDEASHLPSHLRADVLNKHGEWSMFLEDGAANESVDGHYDDLLAQAVEHHAEEILVWSEQQRTYVRLATSEWPGSPA